MCIRDRYGIVTTLMETRLLLFLVMLDRLVRMFSSLYEPDMLYVNLFHTLDMFQYPYNAVMNDRKLVFVLTEKNVNVKKVLY